MKSRALALAVILLLGITLSDVSARSIAKRHVRRDWLIIPDAIAFGIYSFVNGISKEAGETLAGIAQIQILADIRNYLIEKTAAISKFIEEFEKELKKEIKKELEKEKRKQDELNQEKEKSQVA